ncbi:hypothetical protein NL676_012854 [Syzygium grande]|nr:hypothetical protein NL676_012854 [Syzygium grande]
MDPLVRFVVIDIAKKIGFFSFNSMGVPTEDFEWSYRACLVRSEGESFRERLTKIANLDPEEKSTANATLNLEKLQTIFNVNDPYPDFKLDWLSKLKNLHVLYLGSWQDLANHHIEVEGTEFLKGLKHMKHLQFLSLQGISRISELPDSICKLTSLKILDLNACHNLELLPTKFGALKKLTHLDISQCYLLDHIPKELSLLRQLQVLKGFVIGSEDIPMVKELDVLQRFEKLEKLTIVWGGKRSKQLKSPANSSDAVSFKTGDKTKSTKTQQDNISAHPNEPPQPAQTAPAVGRKLSKAFTFKRSSTRTSSLNAGDSPGLQKLELRCFPQTAAPPWLIQGKLKPQKALCICGGNLQTLSMIQNERIT